MTDTNDANAWAELVAWMRQPEVQAAVEKYIPVNMTIADMEWEAEIAFGYDGWDGDELSE